MLLRNLAILFCVLIITQVSNAQSVNLKILRGDSKIGYIHVEKTSTDDSTAFISKSKLTFRMIWKYEWSSTVSSVLKNEMMDWSRLTSFLNDKPRDDKHTFYKGGKYSSYDFDDQQEDIEERIDFTTLMMYYEEPSNIKRLYSERFQKMVSIERLDQHSYKIDFPNGDVNHYHYDAAGELLKVDAFRTWFDLVFVPEKS